MGEAMGQLTCKSKEATWLQGAKPLSGLLYQFLPSGDASGLSLGITAV